MEMLISGLKVMNNVYLLKILLILIIASIFQVLHKKGKHNKVIVVDKIIMVVLVLTTLLA